MTPSTGNLNPTWVKAVVIDNGVDKICFVTTDTIGSDGTMGDAAYYQVYLFRF
jgi:hypothetical protein